MNKLQGTHQYLAHACKSEIHLAIHSQGHKKDAVFLTVNEKAVFTIQTFSKAPKNQAHERHGRC